MPNQQSELCLERVSADEYALLQAYRTCPPEIQQDIRLFIWGCQQESPSSNNVVALPRK